MSLPGHGRDPGRACRPHPRRRGDAASARSSSRSRRSSRRARSSRQQSVENALRVLLAIGGSTNALIHLTAIAGRRGIAIDLQRLNALSDDDAGARRPEAHRASTTWRTCFAAGGIGAVLRELSAAAAPRLPDDHRRDAWASGSSGESTWVDRESCMRCADPIRAAGRPRRAVRHARARRRDHQALGRGPARSSSTPAAPSCSTRSRTWPRASTTPSST